jgi:phosphoribosyl-ATP pyrophosphohydrolase
MPTPRPPTPPNCSARAAAAVETVIAALTEDKSALIGEATDLVFHLLVLLADCDVTLDDIRAEIARREGVSGIDEKAARKKN